MKTYIMKCLLYFIFLTTFFPGFAQDFSGTWRGDLAIDKDTLALILHIKQENAQWTAYMDIPLQDAFKLPAKVSVDSRKIQIEVESDIKIIGEMTDPYTIKAVFLQTGFEQELAFNRISDTTQLLSSFLFKRPQDPKGPFPYDSRDFIVQDGRVTLSGTITTPKGEGRFPAVLLISGSGTHDRDGEMFGHKNFKLLADYFTRRGFVVMPFDDVGIGGSTGDTDYATALTEVKDVELLLNQLKIEPKVNPEKMGLIGQSLGSLISLVVASQNTDVDFLISLTGMGLSGKEMMRRQSGEKLVGLPSEKQQLYYALMDVLGESDDDELTRKKMQDIINNYKGQDPLNMMDTASFNQIFTPSTLCITRLDPADYLKNIHVPVMVLHGGKDTQVLAEENVAVFRKELAKNNKTYIKIYPDLNHLFQKAKTGSRLEYNQLEETFNEKVMADMVEWIGKL